MVVCISVFTGPPPCRAYRCNVMFDKLIGGFDGVIDVGMPSDNMSVGKFFEVVDQCRSSAHGNSIFLW